MGIVQSVFCTLTFCMERILSWACCGLLLIALIFAILMLMVYGISVGYHYAQKELTDFAYSARAGPDEMSNLPARSGNMPDEAGVQENEPRPILEPYQTQKPEQQAYRPLQDTPIVLLATDRSPKGDDPQSYERALARKLIGRFRRSPSSIQTPSPLFHKTINQTRSISRSRGRTLAFK
ncbi:hypothetical protein HW555_000969 [Spodoptera exigua]|uniref:Uncharacterized protein n=1 Tax=Spodoptera exigua TaxID=7107 RepID=A0A835LFX8_SPOEX|nr:hypothetical protein HW555_000969 [Spodoptera exigua]